MSKKQTSLTHLNQSTKDRTSNLSPIHLHAAGIDIGSQHHWVCVPADRTKECVRRSDSSLPHEWRRFHSY